MKLRTKQVKGSVDVFGVTVEWVRLGAQEIKTLRESHVTYVGRGDKMVRQFDDVGFGLSLWKAQVVGWNATNEDGKPIDCNDKYKTLVYKHDQEFTAKVLETINRQLESRKDLESKNSEPGPSGISSQDEQPAESV